LLGEVPESHQFQRMAVGADFLVDLEAALQLGLVVAAEEPGKRPALRLRLLQREAGRVGGGGRLLRGERRDGADGEGKREEEADAGHRTYPFAAAAAGVPTFASTDSVIEAGSGFGRSISP